MKRLYVGNVPYTQCTDEGMRLLFDGFPIESVHVVIDKELNRPRGFCFVEMVSVEAAQQAIEQIDDVLFCGRNVTIRLAHDRLLDRGERRARY